LLALAVSGAASAVPLDERPVQWRLGAETIRLPGNESVGLVGGTYLIGLGAARQGWFVGPGLYGAASGQRGGLFVIGGEALWRNPGPFGSRLEAGLYVGGGGGAAAPVGGGLMLRPQLAWTWPLGPAWVGLTASRVVFPSGRIGSNQLGLVLGVDDRYRHVPAGKRATALGGRSGLGIDRVALHVGRYRGKQGGNHGYVGLRVDRWVGPGVYVGVEGAGAAQGAADGYAEVLASAGAEWPLWGAGGGAAPYLGLRAAAGLAGGGAVGTGGGALVKLAGTLRWNLGPDWTLGLEGGRAVAPDGSLRAGYLHASVGMVLDQPSAERAPAGGPLRSEVHAWSAALSHFPQVRYRDGSEDAVQTVGFRVRRPLSPTLDERVQLAGAAHFAAGGKAGAYGAGLFGFALATPLQQPGWHWGIELLAGAAGGGGVDMRGGALVQPMLRAGWADDAHRFELGLGRVRALRGGLDSPVLEVSYGVAIGLPRR
jgi:hypothetical protein